MASLNTLRTKFGVVLSVIIGLALLAFVLSLKTEMGFSGNDPKVGSIDGEKIKYSEYMEIYDRVKAQNNVSESDPQQSDMLTQATWQTLFSQRVLTPGFKQVGIAVGEQERLGMISGEYPSQVLMNAFADPRTGIYNVASVTDFLVQAESNPQARLAWANLNEQMREERQTAKYLALITNGNYINKLEVAEGLKGANETFTGKWARRPYSSVPDSAVVISSSEIRTYYNNNKRMFEQQPSRTISYVVFDVNATDDDMLALETTVKGVGEEFVAAEDVKAYVRANRNGRIADRYVSAVQLSEDEAAALLAGRPYGPVLKNNIWTMLRVIDEKVTPDTLGIRHIVLPFSEEKLADSLLGALRRGADFAETARQYSVYDATAANGGEVGVMPFSAFTNEFAEALTGAKQNDIVKVVSGDAIQLMQIYKAGKPVRHMQIASITYPVEASSTTRNKAHNDAGLFKVKATGSVTAFNNAASDAALTPRVSAIGAGEREVSGLEDSRELVRWAYGAKVGEVSDITNVNGNYVVAVLSEIDNDKYMSEEKAESQIRRMLMRDKKFDYIAKSASGTTFDALASSLGTTDNGTFTDVDYATTYLDGIGVEPRLVGAIASAEQGVAVAPVKGGAGVYVIEVESAAKEQKQTPEAEQVRALSRVETVMERRSFQAIQQMSRLENLTAKYF